MKFELDFQLQYKNRPLPASDVPLAFTKLCAVIQHIIMFQEFYKHGRMRDKTMCFLLGSNSLTIIHSQFLFILSSISVAVVLLLKHTGR